ncbi:hypothetical protein, partial [Aeromonas veronii]|uniref:hypothetical protein n=1 Tax=Aeromonas veronii TaxID=654 RepID=UPI00406D3CB0
SEKDWNIIPTPKHKAFQNKRPIQKGNAKGRKQLPTNVKTKAIVPRKVPNSSHDTRKVPFVKLNTWPIVWIGGKKMQWLEREKPANQRGPI